MECRRSLDGAGAAQPSPSEVGHRVVSAVAVPRALADCGVAAETVEDMAAQEASCLLVQEGGEEAMPF